VARGQTLAVRHREFVQAARALGAPDQRIIVRHVLRNIMVPLLVVLTLDLSRLVLLEAAMSFLGFGVQPPTPSLGSLVGEGRTLIALAWWPVTYPGVILALYVLAINLVGDALAERMNVGAGR
jgi:peptide/nickel transport system permease protein